MLWTLGGAALLLLPWTIWLSHPLPPTHLARRWNIAWGGLDAGEFVALASTAYLGLKHSKWSALVAPIAGALLLVDAWFDCLTATHGWEYLGSLVTGLAIELPLAFIAFGIAYITIKRVS